MPKLTFNLEVSKLFLIQHQSLLLSALHSNERIYKMKGYHWVEKPIAGFLLALHPGFSLNGVNVELIVRLINFILPFKVLNAEQKICTQFWKVI